MDETVPDIIFDTNGICNICSKAKERIKLEYHDKKKNSEKFRKIIDDLKLKGRKKKYQCIIGISGGLDSSYVAYILKKEGINPLAIHFDNGWNSELAIKNIEIVLKNLNIDLITNVVDWEEFRDIQFAFIKSSISNLEIPTDHAILATLFMYAAKYNLPIVHGGNLSTESIMPSEWMHDNKDFFLINKICKKNNIKIKTFPILSTLKIVNYFFIKRIKYLGILNYLDYSKIEALKVLEKYGYRNYEQKHFESVFTRFFQGYILPKKYNIDKRKAHYSSLILTNQMTREQAIKELNKNFIYDPKQLIIDKEFFCKKFNLDENKFETLMNEVPVSADKYSNFNKYINKYGKYIKKIKTKITARDKY